MDEIKKEQFISAIYLAISNRNYRCANTIFDVAMQEKINNTLDQVIDLVERHDRNRLTEKIRELKYEI